MEIKQKDPAALFYIDTWLSATAEMDADCRGWYLNLILHQFDKGSLPNDMEKLAVLAGVKFSEYQRFEQVFKQVLEQRFEANKEGRLENNYAKKIIQGREQFKDKRAKSGTIGYIIKSALEFDFTTQDFIEHIKPIIYEWSEEQLNQAKDKQMLKQMLEQVFKLYINGNGNGNKGKNKGENKNVKRTIENAIAYFNENGYTKEGAEKFFNYYDIAGWKDSNGKEVKNWKQKAQAIWFKDEYKQTALHAHAVAPRHQDKIPLNF